MLEEEILYAKRSFEKTQELFTGAPTTVFFSNPVACSWYGTEVDPTIGAFCVVKEGEGLGDLVGEFLRFLYKRRTITLYCLAETPLVSTPMAMTRFSWNHIERLSKDEIHVYTRIIR